MSSDPDAVFAALRAADPDVMDRDELAEFTRRLASHQAWCDSLLVRATRRQRALAEQGRAEAGAELAALIADARAHASRLRAASTPAAIALATKMAEQIIGRAVTLAPELMADIAGAALEACRPRGDWVRVRVHPDDGAAVTARRDALVARAPRAAALEIVGDESVGRYGCVIETAVGRVDARLETQLAALERALMEQTHG